MAFAAIVAILIVVLGITVIGYSNEKEKFLNVSMKIPENTNSYSIINDYSEPINIGMPFNSPANDYLYVFDEMTHIGWFATDRFQHQDTVVVYEFVPNKEKILINGFPLFH